MVRNAAASAATGGSKLANQFAASVISSKPAVEGIGNEVLQIGIGVTIATFMVMFAVYLMQRRTREYEIHPEMRDSVIETRELLQAAASTTTDTDNLRTPCHRSFRGNDVTCPICLGDKQLSVETNCGHIFCGQCITTYWHHGNWLGAVICPVCRTEVTILLQNFTPDQEMVDVTAEDRAMVMNTVAMYNRRFSGRPVSFIDQLRDFPMLMRHLLSEFFSLNGLVLMFRIRFIGCCIMALIYIISPFDIIPEAAFGVLGFVDDVLIVLLIAVYTSVTYRRYITSQAMEDD